MNKKQFSEHIGNIDDRLVEQAWEIPNYAKKHHKERTRRFIAAAAVFVLMVCSFSAGAFVFAHETVVEIPVKQEMAVLGETGITLVLPDTWKGKYLIEKNGENYIFFNKQIREAAGSEKDVLDGGVLFYIVCYDEAMTPEQFEQNGYGFVQYKYLFSTSDKTYVLCYASDVQWDPNNPEQEAAYQKMESEIKDIKFIVNNVLAG
ncbi:MAG: hypothetical protein OSJ45_00395 [Lachnospiraceae bacterium]|nr:hypothetical protein [Lachnospiraceae bacterium]